MTNRRSTVLDLRLYVRDRVTELCVQPDCLARHIFTNYCMSLIAVSNVDSTEIQRLTVSFNRAH